MSSGDLALGHRELNVLPDCGFPLAISSTNYKDLNHCHTPGPKTQNPKAQNNESSGLTTVESQIAKNRLFSALGLQSLGL